MLWIESVCSVRCHSQNTAARATANSTVDAMYGTPNSTCKTSAAIVPNTATIVTVSQYTHGT